MENIPVEADIVEIIKEAVFKASEQSPPIQFGHGPESYQNILAQDEQLIPEAETAWLFPFNIDDEFVGGGNIFSSYNILMGFGVLSDFSSSPEKLQEIIRAMFIVSKRFLVALDNDERIKEITGIRREPLYFIQDLTLTGYAVRATIELDFEKFDYCV